jgi:hypothetical protein
MSQIIESRFRVLEFDGEDVLLSDLEKGLPVHVQEESNQYSENITGTTSDLEVGNKIQAEIVSESVTQQDDYWEFLAVDVIENTSFHFLEDANNHPSIVENLRNKRDSRGENSARTTIGSDAGVIGYITVLKDTKSNLWNGLRSGTRSHEADLENLSSIADPPHEVIYTRESDKIELVFYHICKGDTNLAESVITANE